MKLAQKNIDKGWWWDKTWNPIVMRCERVSLGCRSCWHLRFADRMKANPRIPQDQREAYAGDRLPLLRRMNDPAKWKKSIVIAVQLMGDLFHKSVTMEQILSVFSMMNRCQQHTFIVLTKRPERMLEFCEHWGLMPIMPGGPTGSGEQWPANVIAMVTVENQEMADKRIPILYQVPALVRGISVEPMLGLIGMARHFPHIRGLRNDRFWIVCGGENGPGARPMQFEWALSLQQQAESAGSPFFFKAWGRYAPTGRMLNGYEWSEFPDMPQRQEGQPCKE